MAAVNLTAAGTAPDEARVAKALGLIVTADVAACATAAQARERLARWRLCSDTNEVAYAEALRRWQAMGRAARALGGRIAEPTVEAPAPAVVTGGRRRRQLLGVALVGSGAFTFAAWRGRTSVPAAPLFAGAWQTGTAQLLRVTLPDGDGNARSEIVLGADTSLRVELFADRREVTLRRGEARFDVARNAMRPFTVATRAAAVRVVGTVFTVADRGGAIQVAVEHGVVHVRPDAPAAAGGPIVLRASEALTLRDGEAPGAVRQVAGADIAAWRQGWLVFDDVPLGEAVAAINAFRTRPVTIADAATGRLRLTARLHALDEPSLLAALPAALPIRADVQADGGVRLTPRR